jgi:hypothetical protein
MTADITPLLERDGTVALAGVAGEAWWGTTEPRG